MYMDREMACRTSPGGHRLLTSLTGGYRAFWCPKFQIKRSVGPEHWESKCWGILAV